MPTTSSSVRVDFYNGSVKNTDFYALLSDNRSNVTCSLSGSLTNVKDASLFIDLFEKTSTAKKPFTILPISSVTIENGSTGSRNTYNFTDKVEYSLKMMVVLNDGSNLTGKFSYGNVSDLTAYKFIYRATPDAFSSAVFANPDAVYTGSSVKVTAPMSFLTAADALKDARRPRRVRASFDVLDRTVPSDDNSELLNSYCPEVDFSDSGDYVFLTNTLQNGYSYSCTLEAIYDDGYKPFVNVAGSVNVFVGPIITNVEAFGLGVDNLSAGDATISSVMDVTMQTETTGLVFTGGNTITFKLSQGSTAHYSFTVPVQSGPNPVYKILNEAASGFIDLNAGTPILSTAENQTKYYAFDVTAERTYTSIYPLDGPQFTTITKISNIFPEKFVLDVNSLGPVLVDNQWTRLGVAPSRRVELDSVLTQQKWNLISENGYLSKFSKNSFFGTGIPAGELFQDVDTSSTKFKVELSQDSGVTFAPVKSLRMKQGTTTSSATVDRAEWIDLLSKTALTNDGGLYNNIPWTSAVLGPQQPPIYLIADCDPASPILIPGVFTLNGVQTRYTEANMLTVKADSTITVATIPGKEGLLIKNGANIVTTVNGVTKTTAPKINLYYYTNPVPGYIANVTYGQQNPTNSFTLNQATGLGLYAVFNQNSGAKQMPFFIVYTTQTGTGDKASWYKSNVVLGAIGGTNQNTPGLTLAYTGTDDLSFRPDILIRVKYDYKPTYSKANDGYASELVKYLSFHTSSNILEINPGDFNFQLLETGMFTSHALTGLVSLTYNEYNRIAGIFSLNGVRTTYTDVNMLAVKADSTLTVATIPDKDGWLIKNGANITKIVNGVSKTNAPKVNLYYYINPVPGYIPAVGETQSVASKQTVADSFTLNQATGLGLYAVFNQNSGAKQMPFFIVYTTQTGTGDKASWYKSNVVLGAIGGTNQNTPGLTLAYTGTDDLSFRPDILIRVKYDYKPTYSKANDGYASELVKYLSFHTSSNILEINPGDFNFQLLETGMFTSHALTGLVSLTYNEYSRLVLQVSIEASAATRPTGTQSNQIRLMNKVNTPTTGESGIYNIAEQTLTVTVDNSDAADRMTGVLFTSNLVSPDTSAMVPKPDSAISNSFTFDRTNISKQSLISSSDTECKFKIAYNVIDHNGGSDITGLQGPEISVPLRSSPGRANYVITDFGYKTMNDHSQSSFHLTATFNNDNETNIAGLKCYFNTTADFSSSSTKVMVRDIKRSDGVSPNAPQWINDVRLDNLGSIFDTWTNLSVGFVEFVPYFSNIVGGSDVTEIPSQQTRYGIYNVRPIASVLATLEGGVVQAATTLKWAGGVGAGYNLSRGASDLSSGIVFDSGANFSYVIAANTLTAGTQTTLKLKKKQTLPQVAGTSSPLFITLAENTWYGPVTDVTFTPVSVDTSSMVVTVKRGSNATQLLTSHAPATGYDSPLLNVTENKLTKVVGSVATPLEFSGTGSSDVQAHSVTNTHTLSETLASLLDLRMRVAAGVNYTSKVGTANTTASISVSVVLPLGPSTPYRLAGAPLVTSSNKYMVNNGKIEVPVTINANGLAVEGLSTVVAFITQSSNHTESTDTQSGDGPTVLAVFGPGSNRTYTVGSNASAISTTDNLAPGEVATTTSENLSDPILSDPIDDDATPLTPLTPFTLTLALGTLAADDATVLSFPTTGFNAAQPIQIILIVTTRLGHRVLGTTLNFQPPL